MSPVFSICCVTINVIVGVSPVYALLSSWEPMTGKTWKTLFQCQGITIIILNELHLLKKNNTGANNITSSNYNKIH